MSKTVDTRTVEMRFDNKNFESNAKQTMSTLDKLKRSLKLDGASKGLEEVEKKSKKLDFKDFNHSVDGLGKKFTLLEEIGIGALRRIGERAADTGIRMVKSLSIDQVTAGWNKYEEKTTAVQTIMANLKDDATKFVDQASKMNYVGDQLKKLMWFSDETSYSFTDMTSNVGKFIANGQGLEESITAMQGIATWAAISGQNAQTASRVMYNVSQAMGTGAMTIKDWMSVENANMATAQFKELAITIGQKKNKIKEGQVTVEGFRESLSGKGTKGWFDKEVMMEVFETYGSAAERIREYAESHDITTSEAIREIKEQDKEFADSLGFKAFAASQEAKTFSEVVSATADAVSTKWSNIFENIFGNYLQAKEMWTNLSEDLWDIFAGPLDTLNDILEIWNKGFAAKGSENVLDAAYLRGDLDSLDNRYKRVSKEFAKQQVAADSATYSIKKLADGTEILSIREKDAVGNYKTYTRTIYDADSKLVSGRTFLMEGFKNIIDMLFHDTVDDKGNEVLSVLGIIKKAFAEVFFPGDDTNSLGEKLYELTKKFKDFTEKIKPSQETIDKLKNSLKGFFTIFKIIGKFIKAIITPFKEFFGKIFGGASEGVLGLTDSIGGWIQALDKFLDESKVFEKVSNAISSGLNKISEGADWLSKKLTGLSLRDLVKEIKTKVMDFFNNHDFKGQFEKVVKFFKGIIGDIEAVETDKLPDKLTPIQNFWIGLKKIFGAIKKFFEILSVPFKKIGEIIGNLFDSIFEAVSGKSGGGNKADKKVSALSSIWEGIKGVFDGIVDFFDKIKPALKKIGQWLGDRFRDFGDAIGKFAENHSAEEIIEFILKGGFIASLTDFFFSISGAFNSFKGIGKSFTDDLDAVGDVLKSYQKELNASTLFEVALSIGVLAASLWLIAKIPSEKLGDAGKALGIIGAAVAGFSLLKDLFKSISNLSKKSAAVPKASTVVKSATDGLFSNIKGIFTGVVKESIFANDNTAKFVKVCLGILLAAAALMIVVKTLDKTGDVLVKLGELPAEKVKAGGMIAGQLLLAFGAFAALAGTANKATSALFAAIAAYVLVSTIKKVIDLMADLGQDDTKMEAVRKVVDKFKDVFQGLKKLIIVIAVIGGLIAAAQLVLVGFMSFGKGDSKGIANTIKQFGNTFIKIALALVIFSAAVGLMALVVSNTDPNALKMVGGLFAIFALVAAGVIVGSIALSKFGKNNKVKDTPDVLEQLGKVFTRIAASLLIVALAFGLMAMVTKNMDPALFDRIKWMFLLFVAFAGAFIVGAIALSRFGDNKVKDLPKVLEQFGKVFTRIAASLLIVVAAFVLLSLFKFESTKFWHIAIVLGSFLAIVGTVSLAAIAMTRSITPQRIKDITKLLMMLAIFSAALAASLLIVAGAFALMASIEYKHATFLEIAIALGSFLVIVGAIGILGIAFLKNKNQIFAIISVAGLMVVAAASLILVAVAFNMLAKNLYGNKMEQFTGLLWTLFGVIALLAVIGAAIGALVVHFTGGLGLLGIVAVAGLLLVFAASLVIVAKAVDIMSSSLSEDKMKQVKGLMWTLFGIIALLSVIGIIATFGLIGIVAIGALLLVFAHTMEVVATAINILVKNLTEDKLKQVVEIISVIKSLLVSLAIIGALAGVTVVGSVGILAIAALIIALGVACILAGIGIGKIVDSFAKFTDAFGKFVDIVSTKGKDFVKNIAVIVNGLLDTIIDAGPKIVSAVHTVIVSVATGVSTGVKDSFVLIAEAGSTIVKAFAAALSDKNSKNLLANSAGELLWETAIKTLNTLSELVDPLIKAIIKFINSVANGLRDNLPELISAGTNMAEALMEGFALGLAEIADKNDTLKSVLKFAGITSEDLRGALPGLRAKYGITVDVEGDIPSEAVEAYRKFRRERNLDNKRIVLDDDSITVEVPADVEVAPEDVVGAVSDEVENAGTDQSLAEMFFGNLSEGSGVDALANTFSGFDFENTLSTLGVGPEAFTNLLPEGANADTLAKTFSGAEGSGTDFVNSLLGSKDEVNAASTEVAKNVEGPIKNLDSYTWGSDLIGNFGDGMLSRLKDVYNISDEAAQTIRDILGFSEPKKGPLSNFHTFAPDMIKLWCSGVRDNLHLIDSSSDGMASRVDDGFSTALDYVSRLIEDGMTDELTIRPVMDLSEIQNGAQELDSILGNRDRYSYYGTADLTSSTAYSMRSSGAKNSQDTPLQPASNDVINNTFNITSNDPNAVAEKVSRIIQRQVNRKQAVWAK